MEGDLGRADSSCTAPSRSHVRAVARRRLALTCVLLALLALFAVPQTALAEETLVNGSSEEVVKPGQPLKPDPKKVATETVDVEPKGPPRAIAKQIDSAVAAHSTAVSAQSDVYEANREVLRLKGQGLDTTAADQRLADARARLATATPKDIAADQAVNDRIADATKRAQLARYGTANATLDQQLKGAAGRAGGFLVGLPEGAGKALSGMASTVMHPLVAWDGIDKEATLTPAQRASRLAAEDRATLTTKATEAIREVDDPAGVGFAKGERAGAALGEAVTSVGVSVAAGSVAGRLVAAGAARLAAAGEEAGAAAAPLAKPNAMPLQGAPKTEPIAKPAEQPIARLAEQPIARPAEQPIARPAANAVREPVAAAPPKPEPLEELGEGDFSVAYRQGNEVVKHVKPVVPGSVHDVALDAQGRARLASTTVDLTNKVSDAVGGGIVPKMVNEGNGVMRQPLAEGFSLEDLEATDHAAFTTARFQVIQLTQKALKNLGIPNVRSPILRTPDGWTAFIDDNAWNFRFDAKGRVLSWFDPVWVAPKGPKAITHGPMVIGR